MEYVRRELEPRDLGEILREAFKIYGRNFLKLIAIAAIVMVPLAIINFFVREALYPGHRHLYPFVSIVISTPLHALMLGTLVHATCEQHLHQPVSIRAAYKLAWRRLANLVLAELLFLVAISLLAISCVGIPFAIYLGVKWVLAPYAIVIEGCGPIRAFSRSGELVKGIWWRVFGILLVLMLIMFAVMAPLYVFQIVLSHVVHGTTLNVIRSVTSTPFSVLVVPFSTIGITLLYYDLRLRKEEFNIDIMAQELGIETTSAELMPTPRKDEP